MTDGSVREVSSSARRVMLKIAGGAVLAGLSMRNGFVRLAHAAQSTAWPARAFEQTTPSGLLDVYFHGSAPETSEQVMLIVPEIAENGAVVPVKVATTLPKVSRISLMAPGNPFTLAASYDIPDGTDPYVSCRLKMAKTADIVAVVESDGKLYSASRSVKVTLGGCG